MGFPEFVFANKLATLGLQTEMKCDGKYAIRILQKIY